MRANMVQWSLLLIVGILCVLEGTLKDYWVLVGLGFLLLIAAFFIPDVDGEENDDEKND